MKQKKFLPMENDTNVSYVRQLQEKNRRLQVIFFPNNLLDMPDWVLL